MLFKFIFSKFVPIVASETVDSLGAEKKFRIYTLLPLMLLANNDCAIDGTGSMITGSRPFYWILLKEANLYTYGPIVSSPFDVILIHITYKQTTLR